MEDITKMTDDERAQYIENLLNTAVEEENEALNVSNRLQEEINNEFASRESLNADPLLKEIGSGNMTPYTPDH